MNSEKKIKRQITREEYVKLVHLFIFFIQFVHIWKIYSEFLSVARPQSVFSVPASRRQYRYFLGNISGNIVYFQCQSGNISTCVNADLASIPHTLAR